MARFRRWGGPRPAPYNPDARDSDGDGLVQEGTIWERPGKTKFVSALGDISRAVTDSPSALSGLTLVDEEGNPVRFQPSWISNRGAVIGAPRAPLQIPGIGENRTIGETHGVIGGAPLLVPSNESVLEDVVDPVPPHTLMPSRSSFQASDARISNGILRVDGSNTLNGESVSKRVGSQGEMANSDLPDTMYHVTTAASSVFDDGSLRVNTGGLGLGGGSADELSVSLTLDRDIAEQLFRDMRDVSIARREGRSFDELVAELQEAAGIDGWDYQPGVLKGSVATNMKGLWDDYFVRRSSATGV